MVRSGQDERTLVFLDTNVLSEAFRLHQAARKGLFKLLHPTGGQAPGCAGVGREQICAQRVQGHQKSAWISEGRSGALAFFAACDETVMLSVPDTIGQQHRRPVARRRNTTPSKLICANCPAIQPGSHLQRSTRYFRRRYPAQLMSIHRSGAIQRLAARMSGRTPGSGRGGA